MERQKKSYIIAQREVNHNPPNSKISIRRTYERNNAPQENNNENRIKQNYYQNNFIHESKMNSSSITASNRYNTKYKIQATDKFVNNNNINNDYNLSNQKKVKPINQLNQTYIKKYTLKGIDKNALQKPKNENSEIDNRAKNFKKIHVNYIDHVNSLHKSVNNKSIEKDKHRFLNNNQNSNNRPITSNVIKNVINIHRPSAKVVENKKIDNNQINSSINKSIRPISSNQNYKNYSELPNGRHAFYYNKDLMKKQEKKRGEEKPETDKSEELKYPEGFLCPECQEIVKIQLNPDSLSINTKCKNGHNNKNIPIKIFLIKNDLNKRSIIKCNVCKKKYEKNLLYYCSCNSIICKNCTNYKPHNMHSQIPYKHKNYVCEKHNKAFASFCNECNKNICKDCITEHDIHKQNIIYFKNIIPKEKDIKNFKKELEKISISKEKFNKEVDLFLESLKLKRDEFIKKMDNFYQIHNDIIDNIKMNNQESLNYENICNINNINLKRNLYDSYLKIENNFNKKGKYLLNLISPEEIEIPKYKIKNEIKDLEIKSNKIIDKKYEIGKEININIFSEKNNKVIKNVNIICKNINNIYINNSSGNIKNINKEQIQEITPNLKDIKIIDNNIINQDDSNQEKIKHNGNTKTKVKAPKISKKFEITQKIESCEQQCENKDERCITSFTILKNNRIVFTFKGGIIKFYEFEKKDNNIQLKELLRLEEDEYCFNYAIELQDGNIAACSEDGTVKIIQLFLDENKENSNEKYKIKQIIKEMNDDPIYTIKELENQNLVLGCWQNILLYQKSGEYELINKIKMRKNDISNEYTFSILEISPNEIIASHSESKTLSGHNFNNYEYYCIKNVESNENNNILCKFQDKRDIVFVAFDKGINIVSIIKKSLIQKIILNEIISSLCPIEMNVIINDKNEKVWGLMLGAKRRIFGEKVNYAYSMLQIGFNLNEKDKGTVSDNDKKEIDWKIISRKDRIHYYDITNLQNSIFNKNKETMEIIENKDEQWIFTSGNEDKLFKIWKFN